MTKQANDYYTMAASTNVCHAASEFNIDQQGLLAQESLVNTYVQILAPALLRLRILYPAHSPRRKPRTAKNVRHIETLIPLAAYGQQCLHHEHQMRELRTKRMLVPPKANITTLCSI